MKYFLVLPMLITLSGCFPFPTNMQDESRALGKGGVRLSVGSALHHMDMKAGIGVADKTDAFLHAGLGVTAVGIKQTIFDRPESMGVALVAGGFLGGSYFDDDDGGRDTGTFLGGIVNWYDETQTYTLQFKHSLIDYHSQYNSSDSFDFLLSERFQAVTQVGASIRWRKPDSRYSVKLGVECYLGTDILPARPDFEEYSYRDSACVPVLGGSFYGGKIAKTQ